MTTPVLPRVGLGVTSRRRVVVAAVAVGVLAGAVALVGAGIPSLWGDEVVSIMSARRSWGSLLGALGTVDAVHGVYYAILHLWVAVVGSGAVAVRALSAVAVAVAAGLLVPLARALGLGGRTGIVAGLLFAILPRVAYAGSDARSAALEMAGAVAIALLVARDARTGMRRWPLLGLLLGALSFLSVYLLLLAPALLLLLVARSARERRRVAVRRFAAAIGVAVVVAAPVLVVGWAQRAQVAFLAERIPSARTILVSPWFGDPAVAVAVGLLVAAGLVASARTARTRAAVLGVVAWAVVPSLVILLAGAALGGFYAPRYVGFAAPGVALLAAVGVEGVVGAVVAWLRRRGAAGPPVGFVRVAAVLVVAALAAPVVVAQRQPTARNAGTDWNEVAGVVSAQARPGDGIVFDDGVRHSRRPRLALHAYPAAFAGVADLGLVVPYDRTDGLWDVTRTVTPGIVAAADRVWVVRRSAHGVDADEAVLRAAGLRPQRSWRLDADEVVLWVR